jgi:hypothetical protein
VPSLIALIAYELDLIQRTVKQTEPLFWLAAIVVTVSRTTSPHLVHSESRYTMLFNGGFFLFALILLSLTYNAADKAPEDDAYDFIVVGYDMLLVES